MIKKELINQSIDYIIAHFDENLSIVPRDTAKSFLKKLSDVKLM